MKISLFAIVLFLAFTGWQLNAQTQTSSDENLSDSSRALQFQIGSNFNLSSFQGTVFSYKHHLSKTTALRIGLSVSLYNNNSDNSLTGFSIQGDSLYQKSKGNNDKNTNSIQLSTQHIWYINPGAKFLLYGGAGPFFRYEFMSDKSESINSIPYGGLGTSPTKTVTETTSKFFVPGLMGVLGVEWFATKGISLTAEYGLQVSYTWGKIETKNTSSYSIASSSTKQEGWNMGGSNVKLGLSVYFQ